MSFSDILAARAPQRLDLGEGGYLIVSAQGGRVYGPFLDGAEALDWVAEAPPGDWNIGGERVWIAPERYLNFTDPERMIETYRVDPGMDPGHWRIAYAGGGALRLEMQTKLELLGGHGAVELNITRDIDVRPARRDGDVLIFAYRQELTLTRLSGSTPGLVPWLVRQVAPGATITLSATTGAMAQTVFGAPPTGALIPEAGNWHVAMAGPGFFKAAYHRDAIGAGRLICRRGGDHAVAMVWEPDLAPAASYPESLPDDTAATGQCFSMFYDDGRFGNYGELELYGHLDAAGTGRLAVETRVYYGQAAAVERTVAP